MGPLGRILRSGPIGEEPPGPEFGDKPSPRPPLINDIAARYRERREHRWKPSTLEAGDIYMRNLLIPTFGRLRLDNIEHARVSARFDAASADKPGGANRAFEILRAILRTAAAVGRAWRGRSQTPAPTSSKNPRRPVARYLEERELERLGAVLDGRSAENSWSVATLRLLTPSATSSNSTMPSGSSKRTAT